MGVQKGSGTTGLPRVGDRVDAAAFALLHWWEGTERNDLQTNTIQPDEAGLLPMAQESAGKWQLGLEWTQPRDVRQVVVEFAGQAPADVQIQYWRMQWPQPAPERWPGARRGWIGTDDPFHGQWVTMRGQKSVEGSRVGIVVDPLDIVELGGGRRGNIPDMLDAAGDFRATHRRTLKVRVLASGDEQPRIAAVHAYTGSTWKQGEVALQFGVDGKATGDWSGHAEAYNGYVVGEGTWSGGDARLSVLYTDSAPETGDETLVTAYTNARSFSFRVVDLDKGPIYVEPYDVLVSWAKDHVDWAAFKQQLADMPKAIYDRVLDEPEQSLERAMEEIPALDVTKQEPYGRYVPLAAEAGRQEWALRYNGELFGDKRLMKLHGRDAARLQWPGYLLRYRFGTGDPVDFRERRDGTSQSLLDNWMPIVTSEWLDREIEYTQTAFGAMLDGPMTEPNARRGDEDLVVMMRFEMRNTTHYAKRARLWLVIAPQEELALQDGLLLAKGRVVPAEPVKRQWRVDAYEQPVLRAALTPDGKGTLTTVAYAEDASMSQSTPSGVAYDVDLSGFESATLTLAIPFVSLTGQDEWTKAAALDYEDKLEDVIDYWRGYVESGASLDLPDLILNEFSKAVRAHVAISVDKDPVTGLVVVPAATWSYGACGNEACWQITMLDQAGHHDRARDYLNTFLTLQGAKMLDGNFGSAEGALLGLDLDDGVPLMGGFAYNLDHGYIMECLVSHYRYTADKEWLQSVAPKLVAARDLVTRERKRTMFDGPDGKPYEAWGLMPAGHLEDNPEWRHWFAVNAHAYNGMRGIAEVLGEIEHPEAARLAADAAAFREDVRKAALRAMVESPVVQLLDGTYVPHMPTRTGIRGREWGWFREAAYGAVHLLEANVFEPNEEEMTWVIKDLEDNLLVHRQYGRPVDLEKYWFSQGGVTIQANLMDTGIDYLRRGEIEHGLRSLFNNFGASLYEDLRCFTEHPVIEPGWGVGPFYKTPDEAKALVWLREFLLHEEGDTLHVAMGAPREYFSCGEMFGAEDMGSFFGPVSFEFESSCAEIVAGVDLAEGREPKKLVVHLRHPDALAIESVTVNGAEHSDFDAEAGTVTVTSPSGRVEISAQYGTDCTCC
ncbi:MAG: hypothetical protein ACYC5M_02525 [Anaerolineae bacterium]